MPNPGMTEITEMPDRGLMSRVDLWLRIAIRGPGRSVDAAYKARVSGTVSFAY
jgi:hypothetical protein